MKDYGSHLHSLLSVGSLTSSWLLTSSGKQWACKGRNPPTSGWNSQGEGWRRSACGHGRGATGTRVGSYPGPPHLLWDYAGSFLKPQVEQRPRTDSWTPAFLPIQEGFWERNACQCNEMLAWKLTFESTCLCGSSLAFFSHLNSHHLAVCLKHPTTESFFYGLNSPTGFSTG